MLQILHIDRSAMFRKVMREMILRCGYTVKSVSTREEAKLVLAEGGINLILTGLELDDGSGEDFIKELNASSFKGTPVIVVTSTDSIEMRERLFSMGVADYLIKGEIDDGVLRRYFASLDADDELSQFMRSLKTAVIDDSKLILKLVSSILTLNGFKKVSLFSNPADLLASGEKFDLYICDLVLPGMSGDQLVTRIRQTDKDAIIICISQFTSEKALSSIILAGADDYIAKPFDAVSLLSRLKLNCRSYQYKKKLEALAGANTK